MKLKEFLEINTQLMLLSSRIDQWEGYLTLGKDNAARLLGYLGTTQALVTLEKDQHKLQLLKMLLGDHGYTIYKIMKAKNGG